MKIAVVFLYILFQIVYLILTDGSRAWCGFNLSNHMLFIAFLCGQLEKSDRCNEVERLFFDYLKYALIAETIYTVICVFKDSYWAIYQTDVFAYLWGISFVVLLVYFAAKKDNFK